MTLATHLRVGHKGVGLHALEAKAWKYLAVALTITTVMLCHFLGVLILSLLCLVTPSW